MIWCTIPYYTILYTVLYYTILYYTILYYTILCNNMIWHDVLYHTILYYTILYNIILYHTILYYIEFFLLKSFCLYIFIFIDFVNSKASSSNDLLPAPTEVTYLITDLRHLAVLGSGTFGRVSLVQEVNTKKIFALKAMLKTEIVAHKQQNNLLNEKNVMMICNHPFILRLYQTFKDIRKLYMLFEFVQGGELFAVIHTAKSDGKTTIL